MPRVALTEYFHLAENNDWEGETWHFYVPAEGNEEAIAILEDYLQRAKAAHEATPGPVDFPYTWVREELHLPTILRLGSSTGYMDEHNVIEKLDLAKVRAVDWHAREEQCPDEPLLKDHLYKGGLRDLAA